MIADGGDMVVGPWESGWASVAPPGAAAAHIASGALLLGLNIAGCALGVGGASVVPPGPAARRAPNTPLLGLIFHEPPRGGAKS